MKWFIISDIHGSLYWAEKAVKAYKDENADRILILGDILYHGPRNDLPKDYNPKAVIELLNGFRDEILCVRGNCDTEVDQMVLDFPIMADYCIITEGKTSIYATHGHIYNESHTPPLKRGDILLHGHTHVPVCSKYETYTYVNPGSVSIPKENSHHGYIILEKRRFEWKDFESNIINSFEF